MAIKRAWPRAGWGEPVGSPPPVRLYRWSSGWVRALGGPTMTSKKSIGQVEVMTPEIAAHTTRPAHMTPQ